MDKLTASDVELTPYLARLRRRLRLRDGWLLGQRSLWLALLGTLAVQLLGRLWPIPHLWLRTLAPLALWALSVPAFAALRPRPLSWVARRTDAELALKERLATALQLAADPAQDGELPALQRRDALHAVRQVQPRRAFPLRWLRRPLLAAALLAVLAAALALLPNPMDSVLEQRAQVDQAAADQAAELQALAQDLQTAAELAPEDREALLRELAELSARLQRNPGDLEEALADLSAAEDALRLRLDPDALGRQAMLDALARQLQALSQAGSGESPDEADAPSALDDLAAELPALDPEERQAAAASLASLAAQAAQAGDSALAQALAALSQAALSGDADATAGAAQAAGEAIAAAQAQLSAQEALQDALAQLQASRNALVQAGEAAVATAGGQASGQAAGQAGTSGQGQSTTQSPGAGQGQGSQPGGGGGTQADTLPPWRGSGTAARPQGPGDPGAEAPLDSQLYVPRERRTGAGEQLTLPGQDSGEGETQIRERQDPLPGSPSQALVPYQDVYYRYRDAANQAIERSYVPAGLRDYVRAYFSQLEP